MAREVVTPAELIRVRFELGGLTQDQAAAICATDRKTFGHWERGRRRIPVTAYRLLYFHVCGFPIATCAGARDQWEGWRFVKGELWSPENVGFSAGEIRALPYLYSLIGALQRELDNCDVRPAFDDDYKNVLPFRRRE